MTHISRARFSPAGVKTTMVFTCPVLISSYCVLDVSFDKLRFTFAFGIFANTFSVKPSSLSEQLPGIEITLLRREVQDRVLLMATLRQCTIAFRRTAKQEYNPTSGDACEISLILSDETSLGEHTFLLRLASLLDSVETLKIMPTCSCATLASSPSPLLPFYLPFLLYRDFAK
ncbi:hypothetical protein SCHPADRAFT_897084 [Schizopora paradoxa]|uniref:Uncharacterized protein n=1 Tax=Schizopora paradoxa TaxID=27342 RepID=A0A0H2QY98_9AGAM|nr:hypothetical protein SCHPADRAFT_897084 [Schizopora paradoxa]